MSFRNIVLFSAVGFLVYKLVDFISHQGYEGPSRSEALRRALNENPGRMNVTGTGRGKLVEAEDPDGARSRHVVGRGVVS